MSGKRRVWFNGKLIHDSKQRFQKSSIPHRFRWEGGGYKLECLSLKSGDNYKVNLIVDDIPFIKLPRRTAQISLKDVLKPRRMCRADGTWGDSTAITLGCASEHLGKRLSGSKRRITYTFVFLLVVPGYRLFTCCVQNVLIQQLFRIGCQWVKSIVRNMNNC